MQLDSLRPNWPLLNRLLDDALLLAPAERAGWLQRLDGADAALRPTLQQLLRVQLEIETGDFLRRPPPLPDPGPQASDQVGPYRLRRRIGSGGMATVWLAERADGGLKRAVALKLPRLGWDEGIAARMGRERDIVAALEHPHIARLHDAGVDELGRPWLALEYVQGRAIDRHCRERGLDTRARVQLLLQVASAVAYAHSRQVVHRDLKPANILVGDDGRVRLLDFGIAKLLQGDDRSALTQLDTRALTLAYASPEQVRGESVGAASDIYSLGVVAYELLAGSGPYRLQRGSAAALEEAITGADILPPSQAATDAASARALKGNLDAIIGNALRRDPRERTASAQALADDLQRHLDGEPVSARAESAVERLARRLLRWRRPLAAAALAAAASALALGLAPTALAIAALGVGLVLASWQARQARRQAAQAQAQARRADAVQQVLSGLLESAGIGATSAAARAEFTVGQWLDRAAAQLRAAPASDAAVQESLLEVVSRLLHGLGAFERAAALRQDLAQRLHARGAAAAAQASAQRALGESLLAAEDVNAACVAFEAGLAQLDRPGARGHAEAQAQRALLGARLGVARLQRGQIEQAAACIESAAAMLDVCDAAQRADLLGALAMLRGEQDRVGEARSLYHEAIAADGVGGDTLRPEAIERRRHLARMLRSRLHHSEAEAEYRSALAAVEQAGGPRHPATVALQDDLSQHLSSLGRVAEAGQLLRAASAVVDHDPSAFPPLTRPRLQLRLAELLLDDGRIEEAGPWTAAAADPLCTAPGVEASMAMLVRARYLTEVGRFDEALHWTDESLARRAAAFGEHHPYTLSALNRVAVVQTAAARFELAAAAIDRILAVDGTADAAAGPATFGAPRQLALANRVQLQIETGHFDAALAPVQGMLDQLLALPPGQRSRFTEIALRLRCARALLGSERPDEARVQLEALDQLTQALYEHAPLRIAIEAAWAETLLSQGDPARARERLAQAGAHLQAQPTLGPQWRRYPDQVAALLARAGSHRS